MWSHTITPNPNRAAANRCFSRVWLLFRTTKSVEVLWGVVNHMLTETFWSNAAFSLRIEKRQREKLPCVKAPTSVAVRQRSLGRRKRWGASPSGHPWTVVEQQEELLRETHKLLIGQRVSCNSILWTIWLLGVQSCFLHAKDPKTVLAVDNFRNHENHRDLCLNFPHPKMNGQSKQTSPSVCSRIYHRTPPNLVRSRVQPRIRLAKCNSCTEF